jgi:hypothetical protein
MGDKIPKEKKRSRKKKKGKVLNVEGPPESKIATQTKSASK